MKQDDFFKLMRRVKDISPLDPRVVAALDHPDVQVILLRHRKLSNCVS